MKRIIFIFCFLASFAMLNAQNRETKQEIQRIKNANDYFYGEASGTSVNDADRKAKTVLRNNIAESINQQTAYYDVESDMSFVEQWSEILKSYNSLDSEPPVEQIIISDRQQTSVFCYISKDAVNEMFNKREDVVKIFLDEANDCCQQRKIGDALCEYYWGLMMCRSHPKGLELSYYDESNDNLTNMYQWVNKTINEVLDNVKIKVKSEEKTDTGSKVMLTFTYNNEILDDLEYKYYNGKRRMGPVSVNNSDAIADLAADIDNFDVFLELEYNKKAKYNPELYQVLEVIQAPNLEYTKNINMKKFRNGKSPKGLEIKPTERDIEKADFLNECTVKRESSYQDIMNLVVKAIKTSDYESVRQYFTSEGYDFFMRMIDYGQCSVIGQQNFKMLSFNGEVICHGLQVRFDFENGKSIIENVSFRFDPDNHKIISLAYRLTNKAESDILGMSDWSDSARMTLITFMEDYQTAFALKRIDYLNTIFSEDALIIVGHVLEPTKISDGGFTFKDEKNIEYNRYNKEQYINKLRENFNTKKYIYQRFSNTTIKQSNSGGVFGIQIKQEYYSDNYSDVGYLFLMVDFNGGKPIIHVRTWQPDLTPMDELFNLRSFRIINKQSEDVTD